MLQQYRAGCVGYPHHAIGWNHKGFVVRAILFCGLRHQAHIGHAAHRCRVKCAVCLAIVNHSLINAGIATVGNNGLGFLLVTLGIPHGAGITHDNGHGGIDNNVAGHMQIGNTLVGIHHRQGRTLAIQSFDVALDCILLVFWQRSNFGIEVANPVIGIEADLFKRISVFGQYLFIKNRHNVTKNHRVGHLHHGGLQMH